MEMQTVTFFDVNGLPDTLQVPRNYNWTLPRNGNPRPDIVDALHPVTQSNEAVWGPGGHLLAYPILNYREPLSTQPNYTVQQSRLGQFPQGDYEVQFILDECNFTYIDQLDLIPPNGEQNFLVQRTER